MLETAVAIKAGGNARCMGQCWHQDTIQGQMPKFWDCPSNFEKIGKYVQDTSDPTVLHVAIICCNPPDCLEDLSNEMELYSQLNKCFIYVIPSSTCHQGLEPPKFPRSLTGEFYMVYSSTLIKERDIQCIYDKQQLFTTFYTHFWNYIQSSPESNLTGDLSLNQFTYMLPSTLHTIYTETQIGKTTRKHGKSHWPKALMFQKCCYCQLNLRACMEKTDPMGVWRYILHHQFTILEHASIVISVD